MCICYGHASSCPWDEATKVSSSISHLTKTLEVAAIMLVLHFLFKVSVESCKIMPQKENFLDNLIGLIF